MFSKVHALEVKLPIVCPYGAFDGMLYTNTNTIYVCT